MEMMIWNIILTGIVGVIGFVAKSKFEEVDRLGILLNKTREEVARDHITRAEMNTVVEKLGDRFDRAFERLESKVESLGKRD